jgi:UDP-glucose 4-epimerase
MKKKILIVGGCGYIGSRLISFFDKEYFEIKVLDNQTNGDPLKINNYKIDYKNLTTGTLKKFDYIIFLAAHSSVKACNDDIIGAVENNIINTKKLIDKIKKIKKVNFIFASSAAIYNGINGLAKENLNINFKPNQLYDVSKYYIENYITENLKKFYILRFSTVSGFSPNQNNDLIINKMYLDSMKKRKITVINPNTRKSVLFIDDLCKAVVKIIKTKKKFGIYNLSSLNLKIIQIAKKIANTNKSKIVIKKGQTHYSFFTSNEKFSKNFKFKFISDFKLMIESFY